METPLSLKDWLQLPCLPEEVKGDANTGFYLGIEKNREKIKYMEINFGVVVNYSNFHHFLFNRMDKQVFASGSIEIEILQNISFVQEFIGGSLINDTRIFKRLVGAYSFNIQDYDNPKDRNEQYAGTLKSLCIGNAFGNEYPQFGSLLNSHELTRSIQGKRIGGTSSAIKDFQKKL